MTEYRCKNCGWQGSEIIEWEERPRDEFWVMCPKCHHTDECIEAFKDGQWIPALTKREPAAEEAKRAEVFYENISKIMSPSNIFLESAEPEKNGAEAVDDLMLEGNDLARFLFKKSKELKPCPKCGSRAVRIVAWDMGISGRAYVVGCVDCGIKMEDLRDMRRLIKRWNE